MPRNLLFAIDEYKIPMHIRLESLTQETGSEHKAGTS
jgi:hypothetical protein